MMKAHFLALLLITSLFRIVPSECSQGSSSCLNSLYKCYQNNDQKHGFTVYNATEDLYSLEKLGACHFNSAESVSSEKENSPIIIDAIVVSILVAVSYAVCELKGIPRKTSFKRVERYCSQYKLNEEYGFFNHLFNDEPLPPEFEQFEQFASNKIIKLNTTKQTRKAILELARSVKNKKLSVDGLSYHQTLKLYSIMTYLANSYIFCEDDPVDTLPAPISVMLYESAKKLEIRPVYSYTSCAFWNAALIDPKGPVELDNMKTRLNFTDNPGEGWFILIPVNNDIIGFKILKQLILAQEAVESNDPEAVTDKLLPIASYLESMITKIKRMGEKLEPEFFSNELRRYFNGYQKFEKGLKFEGVAEYESEGCRFSGATAGQSPFYQTFENAMGLIYGDKGIDSMRKDLLEGMAKINKEMVVDAKQYFGIRSFAIKHQGKVRDAYNGIIDAYVKYKQVHWSLIARFIIAPAKNIGIEGKEKRMAGTAGTPVNVLKNMAKMLEDNKI